MFVDVVGSFGAKPSVRFSEFLAVRASRFRIDKILKYNHDFCCKPRNLCTIQYRNKIDTMNFPGYCLRHRSIQSSMPRLQDDKACCANLFADSNAAGRSIPN